MKTTAKHKAVLFVRVSTEQQDYNRQIDDLTRYAAAKDLQVAGTIAEKISGTVDNKKRPGLQELLQRIKKKEFDTVIVSELSRLGRNAFQVQQLIEDLTALKVCVYVQNPDLQTLNETGKRTPMTDFLIAILLQVAQMENHQRTERILSGLTRARSLGRIGGRPKGAESTDVLLKKYPGVVKDLKANLSIRQIEKIRNVSHTTILKIKKAMQRIGA
jgi:DNA invertase Pin-like site-specific DNA recombinase